jgi:maltose phosphorylase
MAGTWMSVVKGFGGMRVRNGKLYFNPFIPDQWKSYSFRIEFRGRVLKIKVSKDGVETKLESGNALVIDVKGQDVELKK